MSATLEIPDSGTVTVRVRGEEHTLDAYETYNRVIQIQNDCADADLPAHEFHARVVALLESRGLPRLNHFQADQFVQRLTKAVDELGKAPGTGPTPDSPPSTAPVPSDCPPA